MTNAFQKNVDKLNHKRNKIWVDKGCEFYNRLMKSWLEKNDIEMYSTNITKENLLSLKDSL